MKLFPLLLLLVGSCSAQVGYRLPDYSAARTDLTAVPWPSVPPQMGSNTCIAGSLYACGNQAMSVIPANNCFADPNFGNIQVCRLTDVNSGRPAVKFYNITTAKSGSGDDNLFNPNSDRIILSDNGGATWPETFADSGAVMSASRMYPADPSWSATGGYVFTGYSGLFWSRVKATAYIAYGLSGNSMYSFDLSSTVTPPTPQLVLDFTAALTTSKGSAFGTASWTSDGANNFNDSAFGFAFADRAGQDNVGGRWVAVWKRGQGYRVIDIGTGTVSGDWGPTGAITGTPCRIARVHNVKMAKSANTIVIAVNIPTRGRNANFYQVGDKIIHAGLIYQATVVSGNTADVPEASVAWNTTVGQTTTDGLVTWLNDGADTSCNDRGISPYLWSWDSLTYQPICSANCGGHFTDGMTHWFNNAGNPIPDFFDIRDLGNAAGSTGVITAKPSPLSFADWHGGWNSLDDTFPIVGTSVSLSTPCVAPSSAWDQEVIGIWPFLGKPVMRFAKTLASGCNPEFNAKNAISAVSQDERYLMFSSDWLGTLGAASSNGLTGGTTCDNSATFCRGDVFVVRIAPPLPVSAPSRLIRVIQ